jgi:hypothetical protein
VKTGSLGRVLLVAKVNGSGNHRLAKSAIELLDLLRDILKLSRIRLHQLDGQFGRDPSSL